MKKIDFIDDLPTRSDPVLCWGYAGLNFMLSYTSLRAHQEGGETVQLRREPHNDTELAAIAAFLIRKSDEAFAAWQAELAAGIPHITLGTPTLTER